MRERLRLMLYTCRDQFKFYADQHRSKSPPQEEKAATNESLVDRITELLSGPDAEIDHQDMVRDLQKPGEAILAQMTPLMAATIHMAGAAQSEAGELFDAVKRWAFFGKFLDRENVVEELGDIEFYLEGLRQNLGISREETLIANLSKLVKGERPRYPGGVFSDVATIARADKQPGDIGYAEPTASDPLGQGLLSEASIKDLSVKDLEISTLTEQDVAGACDGGSSK